MKISYILQMKDFSIMFLSGLCLGIFYSIINLFLFTHKHIVLQIIADLIFSFVTFGTFLIFINAINYGQFRFFLLAGYLLGFLLERISLGKLFAKCFKKLYNRIVIIMKKFAKSKVGRTILK